jgi:hypothetical protein
MRKYCVNPIVANAEGVRVSGIDGFAMTEWRLRRVILYIRVRISIAVRKGADVGGTSSRVDECTGLARIVGWVAWWILVARSIHTVLGAFCIRSRGTRLAAEALGAKCLPIIASTFRVVGVGAAFSGVGGASGRWFERKLILSTIRKAGDRTVPSHRFLVVSFDDVIKNVTIRPGRRKLRT